MAIETELKLRISPADLARLRRNPLFKTHQLAPPVTLHLHNIYYDTPGLDLHRGEMALRLRNKGGIWLQTLKGGGSVKAGLHQRNEWEMPVSAAKLDLSLFDAEVCDAYLPSALREQLLPVFVTDFYRTTRELNWQGAEIEVCMDHGEVKTADHSSAICEVELELKSGDAVQLFQLALALLKIVPVELELVSKAEQGFRLLSGESEQPVKGVVPEFKAQDKLTGVLQAMIWSCLLHMQSNLRGAMTREDAEYLHQMRVALRRLRVVLRMAEKLCADEELTALNQEVSTLAVALGRIREWDVFIAGIARPICAHMSGHAGLEALLVSSERQRQDCYESLRARAISLQQLLLRFAIWMNGGYWQRAEKGAPHTHDFATRHLHKLAKRYAQAGKHPDAEDAARLHKMRILAKKLRYSADFFAGLYGKRKARDFLIALSDVQELLGQSNDVTVAHGLLDEMAKKSELAAHLEAIRLAKGWNDKDLSLRIKMLDKAIRHFNKQRVFWEK
jgi:inorganic triphosphatase YgiF